jgi:hypothetical protein
VGGRAQQVEQADVEVAAQGGALRRRQRAGLVLRGQLVEPLPVGVPKAEPEDGAGGRGREGALLRLEDAAGEGRRAAGPDVRRCVARAARRGGVMARE